MTINEFIFNYCKEHNLIFKDNVGYMGDCIATIHHDESEFYVKVCKKHTFFGRKNTNMKYKAIVQDKYLILI